MTELLREEQGGRGGARQVYESRVECVQSVWTDLGRGFPEVLCNVVERPS